MQKNRDRDLEFVFKVSIYSLISLIGIILGCAESEGAPIGSLSSGFSLAFFSIPISLVGFLFTERRLKTIESAEYDEGRKRFRQRSADQAAENVNPLQEPFSTTATWRADSTGNKTEPPGLPGLNTSAANVLGMIALFATLVEFVGQGSERKLLAGTHLLLYATWIVLFQSKTARLYWFLMALGVLQLAVASVLTTKGWFGISAISYMFAAIWTLSLFSLWRAEKLFAGEEANSFATANSDVTNTSLQSSRLRPRSEVRGSVHHEEGSRWLTNRFVTGVLLTSCSALLVSVAFFAFVPRVWSGGPVDMGNRQDSGNGLGKKIGLAQTVRLGSLGPILESSETVFEISLTKVIRISDKESTEKPLSAEAYAQELGLDEPLFRARVFTAYEKSSWANFQLEETSSKTLIDRDTAKKEFVSQRIRLYPNGTDILFSFGSPLRIRGISNQLKVNTNSTTGLVSLATDTPRSGIVDYITETRSYNPPLKRYLQKNSDPSRGLLDQKYWDATTKISEKLMSDENLSKIDTIPELAHDIVRQEFNRRNRVNLGVVTQQLTSRERAGAIESYLKNSGLYRYTLDLTIKDRKVDPVEDFLFNRKEGHCEYFATALALLLRAEGIPSRLVIGYKGGVPNPTKNNSLEVQQRFAHAWVEAWVTDKVPSVIAEEQPKVAEGEQTFAKRQQKGTVNRPNPWIGGEGWSTFDATPADERRLSVEKFSPKPKKLWDNVQSTLNGLWADSVINMSLDQQEQSIYRPLRKLLANVRLFLNELVKSPAAAIHSLWEHVTKREKWFSLEGGLIAFLLMLAMAGLVGATRWLSMRIRSWLNRDAEQGTVGRRQLIEFYERFNRLMQGEGIVRASTQTQQEFAEMVTQSLATKLSTPTLFDAPRLIARLFYQVRFGEQNLSLAEVNRLQDLLGQMESAMRTPTPSHAKPST
jgi:transglutaminase-like putative cysteine protease